MNNKSKTNVLFTSVGRRSYLVNYFKTALGGRGEIHVANSSDVSPAFRVADYSVVTPLIYDKEYIPFLLEYCKKHKIDAIISLFDIDLPVLARNKDKFKEIGVKVIVSDISVVNICNDKWKTYQFLNENKINTPKTFINLQNALKELEEKLIEYPVIVKPRWGMGSIAIFEAQNEEELKVFYKKTKYDIQRSYLKYESVTDIESSVLIQQKIDGQEYGLDIINDLEGNYRNTICKKKYAMRSGETDCAITVDCQNLIELGRKLSLLLNHICNLDCDVFLIDNRPFVLEMNARFGGGYPFSHIAGANLPQAIIDWLEERETDEENFKVKLGIKAQKDIQIVAI